MSDRLALIAIHKALEALRTARELRSQITYMNQRLLALEEALDALATVVLHDHR